MVEGGPFCDKFSRVYNLSINKDISVVEMFRHGWGIAGVGGLRWRRWLFAWEEELVVECSFVFMNYFLQENVNIHRSDN
jgi:hypothetical protein